MARDRKKQKKMHNDDDEVAEITSSQTASLTSAGLQILNESKLSSQSSEDLDPAVAAMFKGISYDSIDTSPTFISVYDTESSSAEETLDDAKYAYFWERSFGELHDLEIEDDKTTDNKDPEWLELYRYSCMMADQNTLSPMDFANRLAYSGIFEDNNVELKNYRIDLSSTIQRNITLLKRSLSDEELYTPSSCNNAADLIINHILTNIYIQYCPLPQHIYKNQGELDFIAKTVSNLLCSNESNLFVKWDSISNVFKNSKITDKKFYRPDVTFYSSGLTVELGNAEIKPKRACKNLVDLDRIKVLEVAKRQLHLRLKNSKSPEELYTFAMLIHGENIEQYVVYFKNGFYGYTLMSKFLFPTSKETVPLIDNALELLLGFKMKMKNSIVDSTSSDSTSSESTLYNQKKKDLIPTVDYYHKGSK